MQEIDCRCICIKFCSKNFYVGILGRKKHTLCRVPVIGFIFANLSNTVIFTGFDVSGHCVNALSNWNFHGSDQCSLNTLYVLIPVSAATNLASSILNESALLAQLARVTHVSGVISSKNSASSDFFAAPTSCKA